VQSSELGFGKNEEKIIVVWFGGKADFEEGGSQANSMGGLYKHTEEGKKKSKGPRAWQNTGWCPLTGNKESGAETQKGAICIKQTNSCGKKGPWVPIGAWLATQRTTAGSIGKSGGES